MSDKQERSVLIDFLAFSAPLSVMKDVHTFQEKGFEWRKFQFLPSYKHYQHRDITFTHSDYQDIPEIAHSSMTDEQRNRYETDLISCYFSRLKSWLSSVFGLVMGAPRGKGGFFYQDSALLYSDEGGVEHFGVVYWGGNKDSFYVQISGKGCAHVFSGTTPQKIHEWLSFLDITDIKRIDLATDDYDGIFTCEAAKLAYQDDAFYCGKGPKPCKDESLKTDAKGNIKKEMFSVGSRQSRIYWRIYNKAAEQKVSGVWYRSEVELKKVSIDVLLDITGIYVGLCDYAAQINPCEPQSIPKLLGRKAVDSIEAKVRWLRKQASKNIAKVFHFFNGDINTVLSMIIREEHISDMNLRFDIPPIYQTLLNEKLQTNQCPF
ncbi:TPA: replication initiation factor domain-containing protein [Proteus mirabilis]|uniref:replication initiation factor domain-containing protein n=2 Tax=Proteus mirabilis TaxID=584 RepID=UPI00104E22B2|nr:replication initiation factor domain-containing protein [Proteus mirabilis]KAB7717530.1 replication initiation protein [Proteus mirabilis]MBG2962858.1 replication initiation factor domain-containing protein [Proteus mirabilis]MBG3103383.1 replication initiation factor domain-containing protein [Proteus mirabilis]MBG5962166.1 replication initiation factor domain-containing protein [Proteus mirabilis]MCD4599089.1 replication initiation factor domain-containing protein [Proteus mirabilis]